MEANVKYGVDDWNELKKIACPKCGATTDIWMYECEWSNYPVVGLEDKRGTVLVGEMDDNGVSAKYVAEKIASVDPERAAKLEEVVPVRRMLLHGEHGLLNPCHVWSMPDKESFQDPIWKLAYDVADLLPNFSPEKAHETIVKHGLPASTPPVSVVRRYMQTRQKDVILEMQASALMAGLDISKDQAMGIVHKYHDGNDHAYATPTADDIITAVMNRNAQGS
jgi:hypothetical protein